jgi:hypothetical protein
MIKSPMKDDKEPNERGQGCTSGVLSGKKMTRKPIRATIVPDTAYYPKVSFYFV